MPYRTDIVGQVSEFQLRAIEAVAALVPQNGTVVEVGSLFGRSSYAWAKSVPESATVFCVDPWAGNRGIRAIAATHGIDYGIEQFKAYTSDCPNIVAMQGFSPRVAKGWNRPVDLYYEDAVHTNPILSRNVDFWTSHLTENGIVCGDDYRPRFADVRAAAEAEAAKRGRKLWIVDFFWCVLPNFDAVPEAAAVAEKLDALAEEVERHRERQLARVRLYPVIPLPPAIDPGEPQTLKVRCANEGPPSWPSAPAGELSVAVRLSSGDATLAEFSVPTGRSQLHFDEVVDTPVTLPIDENLPPEFELELRISGAELDEDVIPKAYKQRVTIQGAPRHSTSPVHVTP